MPLGYDRVILSLKRHQVEYVIIGATAAVAHGAPIGTIDLDICCGSNSKAAPGRNQTKKI